MLRPNVLLCFGEDHSEWSAALLEAGASPTHRHSYRGIHAWCNDEGLTILAPFGSAAVEAIAWELTHTPGVEKIVLWGTAGWNGPGFPDQPIHISEASAWKLGGFADGETGRPNVAVPNPSAACVATDRFYGLGPSGKTPRYGEDVGTLPIGPAIDMETAAFYILLERFAPEVKRLAVRCVANTLDDQAEMPVRSSSALQLALRAAMKVFEE